MLLKLRHRAKNDCSKYTLLRNAASNAIFYKLPNLPMHSRNIHICKKSCYSTGRVKFFIETFRALGVARGHSVTIFTVVTNIICTAEIKHLKLLAIYA